MTTILIIAILCVLVLALIIFVQLGEQKEQEDWMCYTKKSYRYEAGNGYCAGEDGNVRCGHCLYYKQWKRRNIHE